MSIATCNDLGFIKEAKNIALACGYRPIELCWVTWLIQPEGKMMRMKKYSSLSFEEGRCIEWLLCRSAGKEGMEFIDPEEKDALKKLSKVIT